MDLKKQDGEKTIYVLSTEDAERISEMFELIQTGFWELLASRCVDFPNSFYSKCKKSKKEVDF
jgi:hypothetical protein